MIISFGWTAQHLPPNGTKDTTRQPMTMKNETPVMRRKAICENEYAYLPNGLRCQFGGYGMPVATISSKAPGGYCCLWQTVEIVLARPDRRFKPTELSTSSLPWLGLPVEPRDFQTIEDYEDYRKANL